MKSLERRIARMESTLPPTDSEAPEIIYFVGMTRLPDGEIGGEVQFAMLSGGLGNVSRGAGETEADFRRRAKEILSQHKATQHEQNTNPKE